MADYTTHDSQGNSSNRGDTYITSESSDPKYFFMIPNLVDYFPLTLSAFRLYSHYKRVTGEAQGGACWESSNNLCEKLHVSKSTLTRARQQLEQSGLVTVEKRRYHGEFPSCFVTVKNIWGLNNQVGDRLKSLAKEDRERILDLAYSGKYHEFYKALGFSVDPE